MRIMWDNLIDDYTLEASTEASNFPATNLQDIRLSSPWRTDGDFDESIIIDAGDGETLNPTAVAIMGHNFTSGVTAKIQGNATSVWTSPTVDETITYRADLMVHFFTGSALRFWRFDFADAANPDTYLQIGRLHFGTYLEMPGVAPAIEIPRETSTVIQQSITGQVYADRGVVTRVPAFNFPLITDAERQSVDAMFDDVENAEPVVLVIWPDSLSVVGPIYCRIDQESLGWRKSAFPGINWDLSIAFREVF